MPRQQQPDWQKTGRRALFGWALAMPLALGLSALAGCGWEPLYADREAGPAAEALRAIHVAPIPERIGQQLAQGLRRSFNPNGEATPQRYLLRTTLLISRSSLGVQSQGIGTLGRIDLTGNFVLTDIKSSAHLLAGSSHVAELFEVLANGYATVIGENDADARATEELRRDIVDRLTVFLQRRAAEHATRPGTP